MIVHGAVCVWFDDIREASCLPGGLPCCPHCGSVLYEIDDDEWWKGVRQHDEENPGYLDFIKWLQGKCFKTCDAARKAYDSGKEVRERGDVSGDSKEGE